MIERLIEENHTQLADVIRTLTYQENKDIISNIDFNKNSIFLEPLLFAYFNREQTDVVFSEDMLGDLLQSHFIEKKPITFEASLNKENVAYIPNLGYFRKIQDEVIREEMLYVDGTEIEILRCDIPLMRNVLEVITSRTPGDKHFYVEDGIGVANKSILDEAFSKIKKAIPHRSTYIEKCCKKIFLFKEPNPRVPSRVTINSLGTLFINIYNNEDNLPFFIDTISHLTGSLIMTIMLQDKKGIFKGDFRERIGPIIGSEDRRNFYTLFHRLYCHYSAFDCLHHYLEKGMGTDENNADLIRRMVFHLKKCKDGIDKFNLYTDHYNGVENLLTDDGVGLSKLIQDAYNKIALSREVELKEFESLPVNYRMGYSEFSGIKS